MFDRLGEMAQQLSSLVALTENIGSVPRTPMAISTVIPVPKDLMPFHDLCGHPYAHDTHT